MVIHVVFVVSESSFQNYRFKAIVSKSSGVKPSVMISQPAMVTPVVSIPLVA